MTRLGHARKLGLEGDFWPTPDQEVLLEAALGDGDTALSAWRTIRPQLDLDTLDGEAIRILPMLYRNLVNLGVEDELLPRLKGTYRQTWYLNQLLTGELSGFVTALQSADIETMVLKGAAIVPLYYQDYGVRPMADVDVLVRPSRAPEAARILAKAGWVPRDDLEQRMRRQNHALPFANSNRHEVDLHWNLGGLFDLPEAPTRSLDTFWNGSVPLELGGASSRALNATDTALHVILHGVRGHWGSRLRWPPDALTIIRRAEADIDWDRLIAMATAWHAVLPVRDALAYLRAAFDAPVPERVVAELSARPVSRRERLGYRLTARRVDPTRRYPLATSVAGHYLRWSSDGGVVNSVAAIPSYLALRFGLESSWGVPRHAWNLLRRPRRQPTKSAGPSA